MAWRSACVLECEPRLRACSVRRPKNPLDEVEPGGVGWRKVELEARVAGHPSFDQRGLMRREIVEDHVDGEGGVHPLVDLAQKAHEIPRPMLLLGLRHDLAGRDVERREEVHRAMADVVVRSGVRADPCPSAGSAALARGLESEAFRRMTRQRRGRVDSGRGRQCPAPSR